MKAFLDAVADAYVQAYPRLDKVCFVMPNRRSATFMLDRIKLRRIGKPGLAPRVLAIADFVEQLSGRVCDSRIDLLLMLYDEYRKHIHEQTGNHSEAVNFDNFRAWGDTLLDDFNDVEMWMVDAEMLFRNVVNLREIQSTYLTDEQIAVIKEYFGEEHFSKHVNGFWAHYNQPDSAGDTKTRFYHLWELMLPLYRKLCDALDARGLTFSGRAYRQALEKIKSDGAEAIGYDRVVFVGLNALSSVEEEILSECGKIKVTDSNGRGLPFADYYFDVPPHPVDEPGHAASHFVISNIRKFKPQFPQVYEDCEARELCRDMVYIAAPSNVGQTKIAGSILTSWLPDITKDEIEHGKVAIMLPDENLLFPMLASIPGASESDGKISSVNLTMGYSFTLTATFTFLNLYRRLQRRKRSRAGRIEFLREDVDSFLRQSFAALYLGEERDKLLKIVETNRRFTIPVTSLTEAGNRSSELFTPFTASMSVEQAIDRLIAIVEYLCSLTADDSDRHLDYSHLELTADAMRKIKNALRRYDIAADYETIFAIILKTLQGEKIRMEGEPLTGLQIMGPLETRCLDFNYLIIPSMNERIFPRKVRKRSFIPATLRKGYGMDDAAYQEAIYAYNFYRLLGRAKRVAMIYDARMGETRSGDPSRYLQQLRYVYARDRLRLIPMHFVASRRESRKITLEKKGIVAERLNSFFTAGSKNKFSASNLSVYIGCPLRFCLTNIMGIKEPDDVNDYLSSAMVGNVVHRALQNIYTPEENRQDRLLVAGTACAPEEITTAYIDSWINTPARIDELIKKCIIVEESGRRDMKITEASGEPSAGMEIYYEPIRTQIINALLTDRALCPFVIYGTEVREGGSLLLPDGTAANYTYVIDRLDFAKTKDYSSGIFRIVDYKTGHTALKLDRPDDIFMDEDKKAAFQLLFYAHLFSHNRLEDAPMDMRIFDLKGFKQNSIEVLSETDGKYHGLKSHLDYDKADADTKSYMEALTDMIMEIKDSNVPFTQCAIGSKCCSYCPFKSMICNR